MTKLSLSVQYAVKPSNIPTRHDFRRWIKIALASSLPAAQLTLRIVDEEEGRFLNHTYRQKASATNVLTFTFNDDMPPIPAMPLLGDIVLCVPVIEQEAQEQKKCLMAHYAHLTIHGVLHLQGYDHLRDHDAQMMEKHEIDLLKKLNYANPYANLA